MNFIMHLKCLGKAKPIAWLGYIFAASIATIHIIPAETVKQNLQLVIPSVIVILFLIVVVTEMKYTVKDIAVTLLGIAYIIVFIVFLPMLKGLENGSLLVWYVLASAWGTDTFAYIIGMKFGKHKISKISPNKSLEGCIAGVVGAIAFSLVYTLVVNTYFEMQISYVYISLIALALSVLGQIGDLSASSIKRYTEIKDFGNLIPGHGGMLDRIDSVIFIAPFAYFLLMTL